MSYAKLPISRLVDSYLLFYETEGKSYDTICPYRHKPGAFLAVVTAAYGCSVPADVNAEAQTSEGAC